MRQRAGAQLEMSRALLHMHLQSLEKAGLIAIPIIVGTVAVLSTVAAESQADPGHPAR